MNQQEYEYQLPNFTTAKSNEFKSSGVKIIDRIFDTNQPGTRETAKEAQKEAEKEIEKKVDKEVEKEVEKKAEKEVEKETENGQYDYDYYQSERRTRRESARRTRGGSHSRRNLGKGRSGGNVFLAEKILLQCIVSGIILAATLSICLIRTDTTERLRQSIKSVISQNNTTESVKAAAAEAWTKIIAFGGTVKSVFGFENPTGEPAATGSPIETTATETRANGTETTEPTATVTESIEISTEKENAEVDNAEATSIEVENIEPEDVETELKGERIDEEMLEEIKGFKYR